MALTDQKLRAVQPMQKAYKLFDGEGLYLLVNPTGSTWWRLKYRYEGKEKSLSLGVYPSVPLLEARRRRDDAKRLLASGIDPSADRQEVKQQEVKQRADTFIVIGEEWLEQQAKTLADITLSKARWILNSFVYPKLGDIPVAEITAPAVLAVLREIESRGHYETAQRAKHRIGQILRYADATGRTARDVTASLKGVLTTVKQSHHAAITEPSELAPLIQAMWGYQGKPPVCAALKLSALLFVRPGELRQMEWRELNLLANEWRIPEHKMKMDRAHIVPLARQSIDILTQLHTKTGDCQYVFPNDRGCIFPMSNGAVNKALERLGFRDRQLAHGFRATARTILDEVLGYRPDWIELQLAHLVRDPMGRAYNRTAFLPQRIEMMQAWANYLDGLRTQ